MTCRNRSESTPSGMQTRALAAADRTGRRSTHPVLYLLLIIAIGACALWGVMDLLARVTGIDWPI